MLLGGTFRRPKAMPDATAHPTRDLAPVSPETLPDMNTSGNGPSPARSPIHQPGPGSPTPLDFFGSIKSLVERTLLPSDLEEFGNQAVDFPPADDDGSCCSTPRGYASWGVLDDLNKEADALRNRVRELEHAHENHQQQQREEVSRALVSNLCYPIIRLVNREVGAFPPGPSGRAVLSLSVLVLQYFR